MAYQPLKDPSREPISNVRRAGRLDGDGYPHLAHRRQIRNARDAQRTIRTIAVYFASLSLLAGLIFMALRRHGSVNGKPLPNYSTSVSVAPGYEKQPAGAPVESLGAIAAEKLVSAALRCDPGEVARCFRLEAAMTPAEAHAMLRDIRRKEGEVSRFEWLGIRYVGDKVIEEVAVEHIKDDVISLRLAQIIRQPDGTHKVDFSSYVRKTSHPWEDILDGKVESAVVRVNVAESSYHNGFFRDDRKWQCYAIDSPDIDGIIYGYVESESKEDIQLREILATDEKAPRATLEIRTDDMLMSRQFLINRVIAQDWVLDETSGDSERQ